jgi:peptide/nickel transport system substrate-binding protein
MPHLLPTYARHIGPRPGRPRKILFLLSVILAATCVACGTPKGSGGTASGSGELIWGKPSEAPLLDPTISTAATSWELLNLTYENLVGLDGNLKIVPELAESWRQTSPTTYVFKLRRGVKFSNGREMTADDVAGSLKRLVDPKLAAYWGGQVGIRDATVTSPNEVKVTLVRPRTPFVAALAGTPAAILPMKELRDGSFDPKKQLLGTGAFKVASHAQNTSWVFDRNPYHWRSGRPKASRLQVRIMPEDAARAAGLRDGSIHVTTFERPDSSQLLRGQSAVKTVVQSTGDYYTLYVNALKSSLQDDRLRQAVALSIDRNKIRDVALGGAGRPTAAVPAIFQGVCDPATMPFAAPDIQKARGLVESAGATGKTVEVMTIPIAPMSPAIAQVIQQNLQSTGLKVQIVSLDVGAAIKRLRAADFDLAIGWYAGYADPAMPLSVFEPTISKVNKAYVEPDPELFRLINEGLETAPGTDRTAKLREACIRIAQNANLIPLVSKDAIVAYRSDKVTPSIYPVEGYAVPLRQLAEFTLK